MVKEKELGAFIGDGQVIIRVSSEVKSNKEYIDARKHFDEDVKKYGVESDVFKVECENLNRLIKKIIAKDNNTAHIVEKTIDNDTEDDNAKRVAEILRNRSTEKLLKGIVISEIVLASSVIMLVVINFGLAETSDLIIFKNILNIILWLTGILSVASIPIFILIKSYYSILRRRLLDQDAVSLYSINIMIGILFGGILGVIGTVIVYLKERKLNKTQIIEKYGN